MTSTGLYCGAEACRRPNVTRGRAPFVLLLLAGTLALHNLAIAQETIAQEIALPEKPYRIAGGKVDARTYNGFRRYHASCNHCHGQDGLGSTFGPSLVDALPDLAAFRGIVREGVRNGAKAMKGFADDPNVAPVVDDIYAYLRARADGALGRGRPLPLEP